MNKNKIIFAIIGGILLLITILIIANLNSSNDPSTDGTKVTAGDFTIWILSDDRGDFQDFVTGFKEIYPAYSSKNIIVESFSDRQTYSNALTSAIIS
jgi:hypothetical protein